MELKSFNTILFVLRYANILFKTNTSHIKIWSFYREKKSLSHDSCCSRTSWELWEKDENIIILRNNYSCDKLWKTPDFLNQVFLIFFLFLIVPLRMSFLHFQAQQNKHLSIFKNFCGQIYTYVACPSVLKLGQTKHFFIGIITWGYKAWKKFCLFSSIFSIIAGT